MLCSYLLTTRQPWPPIVCERYSGPAKASHKTETFHIHSSISERRECHITVFRTLLIHFIQPKNHFILWFDDDLLVDHATFTWKYFFLIQFWSILYLKQDSNPFDKSCRKRVERPEVRIYKRKQESKKTRKKEKKNSTKKATK